MIRIRFWATAVLVLASLTFQYSHAAILDVPEQFPTIASALAAANSGDSVKIAPGRYYEHGLVVPTNINLLGAGNLPEETIIDGQGQGRILTAQFIPATTIINNLTFENGWAQNDEGYDSCGGAIYINHASLWIYECRFLNNQAEGDGGAISIMRALPSISNCLFENNRAGEGGGGLDCSYVASPRVLFSTFRNNSAAYGGAVACRGDSKPIFTKCDFDQNMTEGDYSHGGAVLTFFWGEPTFNECIFTRNTAEVGGAIFSGANSPSDLISCTVSANIGLSFGAGIYTQGNSTQISSTIIAFHQGFGLISSGTEFPTITCSNIFGNSYGNWFGDFARQEGQNGNLEVDPLFCEASSGDDIRFLLQEGSPCTIEGGACDDMGAGGIGCEDAMDSENFDGPFEVDWLDGVPQIIWETGNYRGPTIFRLVRSSVQQPTLEVDIPFANDQGGRYLALDTELTLEPDVDYVYRLYLVSESGVNILLATGLLGDPPRILTIKDLGAWPNPFNPQTRIHFRLSSNQQIKIEVYGIDGRRLRTLADRTFLAGPQNITWDGQDNSGRVMASGPYLIVVSGEKDTHRLKVTLLK